MAIFKLENAAVARLEQADLIGHLVWYTVSECAINRTTLRSYLSRVGIDEAFMPLQIRPSDAFRKATKLLERKLVPTADSKVRTNYLVREIPRSRDEIERRLVVETVDSENRRLSYNPNAAGFLLDKKSGTFSYHAASSIENLCRRVADDFEIFKTHHDSRAIRSMIYHMLGQMAPVNVRPSGGVYFIPIQFQDKLQKMVEFIRLLEGQSEAWMMPVIDRVEMRDMVRQKIAEQMRTQIQNMAKTIKDSSNKGNIAASLEEGKQTIRNFSQYQQALDEELEDMQELTSLLKRQMIALADKLAQEN